MKIYLGHSNNRDLKVASSLADKGLNLLKAQPCRIPIYGFAETIQLGYSTYISNLPSYMKATETQNKVAISSEECNCLTPMANCIPIAMPDIFVFIKKGEKVDKILSGENYKELFQKKNGVGYMVTFSKTLVANNSKGIDPDVYPATNLIGFGDLKSFVKVLQVISSLLRTHKYPAFREEPLGKDVDMEPETKSYSYKRDAGRAELATKNRCIKVAKTEYGSFTGYYEEDILHSDSYRIDFRVAKPTTSDIKPWGSTSDLPTTSGIHFPYESDLAQPDPETVPLLLERHLFNSLSTEPIKSAAIYASISKSWKTSIYRSRAGLELSHLAKIILVGLPCQARIFPVVTERHYLGCYLSGAGYSVGLKGEIFRPEAYIKSISELDCYSSNESILQKIAALIHPKVIDKRQKIEGMTSLRELGRYFAKEINVNESDQQKVTSLACSFRQPGGYVKVNTQTLSEALDDYENNAWQDKEMPYDPSQLLSMNDSFTRSFARFGPNVPSINIPGAPKWKIVGSALPEKMIGQFAIRLCSMETAKADWLMIEKDREFRNCPDRLSAIYEHTLIKGKEDKLKMWQRLVKFSDEVKVMPREGREGTAAKESSDGGITVEIGDFGDLGF